MRKTMWLLLLCGAAQAQTQLNLAAQSRNVDFTNAAATKPFKKGIVLPALCSTGEVFFKSDAPAGSNLYVCAAANGWAQVSGLPASVTVDDSSNISTPGSLTTGQGSAVAGAVRAMRGLGTATLGVQGAVAGEWSIAAPADFTPWTFTAPPAPCAEKQWWTTDANGAGRCAQPGLGDLSDASAMALLAGTQTISGDKTFTGRLDASGASHSRPAPVGVTASRPATCTVGEMYFATDATAGQNWQYCTAANTWTAQAAGGGGGGSFSSLSGGTNTSAAMTVGSGASLSTAGSGVVNFGAAGHTTPAAVGVTASRPATCTVGEMYFATDATAGQNWQYCTAVNTWTAQAAGGGGGGGSVTADCASPGVVCVIDAFLTTTVGDLLLGALGWHRVGGTLASAGATAGHWGGMTMTTTAAANSMAGIDLSGAGTAAPIPPLNAEANWTVYFKFRTPASLPETLIEIGLGGYVGGTGITDGGGNEIALQYLNATGCNGTGLLNGNDSSWMYVTRGPSGGTPTRTAGPAIAANTEYWLRIRNTGTPGQILFSIKAEGGAFPADVAIATTLPAVALTPMFKVATCQATAKTMTVREFRLVATGLN